MNWLIVRAFLFDIYTVLGVIALFLAFLLDLVKEKQEHPAKPTATNAKKTSDANADVVLVEESKTDDAAKMPAKQKRLQALKLLKLAGLLIAILMILLKFESDYRKETRQAREQRDLRILVETTEAKNHPLRPQAFPQSSFNANAMIAFKKPESGILEHKHKVDLAFSSADDELRKACYICDALNSSRVALSLETDSGELEEIKLTGTKEIQYEDKSAFVIKFNYEAQFDQIPETNKSIVGFLNKKIQLAIIGPVPKKAPNSNESASDDKLIRVQEISLKYGLPPNQRTFFRYSLISENNRSEFLRESTRNGFTALSSGRRPLRTIILRSVDKVSRNAVGLRTD